MFNASVKKKVKWIQIPNSKTIGIRRSRYAEYLNWPRLGIYWVEASYIMIAISPHALIAWAIHCSQISLVYTPQLAPLVDAIC